MQDNYINILLKQCKKAEKEGNIPISALIVLDNKIISTAYNKKETSNIAIDHAEIIAIKKACKKLKTWRLDNCILYTTLKPCKMCEGAIIEARIKKVYYLLESNYYQNKYSKLEYTKLESIYKYKDIIKKFFLEIRNK